MLTRERISDLCTIVTREHGCRLLSVERLLGGFHASTYRVSCFVPARRKVDFVLRLYPPGHGQHCRIERQALSTLASTTIPSPKLLWSDPRGRLLGAPASVLEWMSGSTTFGGTAEQYEAFARVIARLHQISAPATLPSLATRKTHRHAGIRSSGLRESYAALAAEPRRFLHGDAALSNALFEGAQLTGVIDWSNARIGPPSIDVGAMRVHAVLFGPEEAETRLVAAYRACNDIDLPGLSAVTAVFLLDAEARIPEWCQGLRRAGTSIDLSKVMRRHREFTGRVLDEQGRASSGDCRRHQNRLRST